MNSLFNDFHPQQTNQMNNFLAQFNQFKSTFTGNPEQQVRQLLSSGRMDQENSTDVVDFVVESNNIDFIEKEFDNLFVICTEKDSYVFSNYELIECYEVGGGLIRVICVK